MINKDTPLAFYVGDLDSAGKQSVINTLRKHFVQAHPLDPSLTWISLNFRGKKHRLGRSTNSFESGCNLYHDCEIIHIHP